ncbi:MAG: ImmA/IrrE family metallo-endopeptidase [Candidatus Aquicultorales bacterium]
MPIFTHRYIKDRAESLLAGLGVTRPPINVWKLADGLGLEIVEMTQETWFYGMLLGYRDECYIVVNRILSEPKKRFTIAHELGHYDLHRKDFTYSPAKEKEYLHREADVFAFELCMPTKMVKRAAGEWNNDYRALASVFGVTETAMLRKLDEMGLAPKAKFDWTRPLYDTI